MPKIEDELDWQIYFKKEGDTEPTPFYWVDANNNADIDRPLTFRTAYEQLKKILEPTPSEQEQIKTKFEFKQGHRKRMFNDSQIEELKELYSKGVSKNKIAKMFGSSEKTIRNYLKE